MPAIKVSASLDPTVLTVGSRAVRRIIFLLILVLVLVRSHRILIYKKTLDLRERSRGVNARLGRQKSERGTLLCVRPNTIAANHLVDICHWRAITLVLSARVQYGHIPLGTIGGTVHGKYSLKKSIVTVETNAIHRKTLTVGTECGDGSELALSCPGAYGCGVTSDWGNEFLP